MLKNLKKLFVCFFVLLFSSVSIVNISTVASSFDYSSGSDDYYEDGYEDPYEEFLDLGTFFNEPSRQEIQEKESLDWEILCTKIAELSGEDVPHEIEDQQLMVCRNLYLLFNIYTIEETKRNLKDIFSLLCENDQSFYLCLGDKSLSYKISRILEKRNQRDFYNLYQRFMSKLRIRAKDKKNVSRVDALLLLSYAYLRKTGEIPAKNRILNSSEENDLIPLLNDIFSATVYAEILNPSDSPILHF